MTDAQIAAMWRMVARLWRAYGKALSLAQDGKEDARAAALREAAESQELALEGAIAANAAKGE